MKILTIGGATKDLFLQYKNPESLLDCSDQDSSAYITLEAGKKIEIETIRQYLGGGAANTAVSFSRLGFDTAPIFKVGTDAVAQEIVTWLRTDSINTQLIAQDSQTTTAQSFILPSCQGNYALLVYRGANTHLNKSDIPLEKLNTFDHIYISSLNGPASKLLTPITQAAKQQNVPVAVNPGMAQLCDDAKALYESLQNIDILILNACEAREFMLTLLKTRSLKGDAATANNSTMPELLQSWILQEEQCFNIIHYCKTVMQEGPSIVVVTNGAEGVYVAYHNTLYFCPSIAPQQLVSTVGCGDAFGSTFVANLLQKKSIEECIIRGVLNSSSVLEFESAQEGLLSMQKLAQKAEKISGSIIKNFKM